MDSFRFFGFIYADYNETNLNEPELDWTADPGLEALEADRSWTGCICVCLETQQLLYNLNS